MIIIHVSSGRVIYIYGIGIGTDTRRIIPGDGDHIAGSGGRNGGRRYARRSRTAHAVGIGIVLAVIIYIIGNQLIRASERAGSIFPCGYGISDGRSKRSTAAIVPYKNPALGPAIVRSCTLLIFIIVLFQDVIILIPDGHEAIEPVILVNSGSARGVRLRGLAYQRIV